MTRTLLLIACHGYGFAAVLYLAYLVRQSTLLAGVARWSVGASLTLHAVAVVGVLQGQGWMPDGLAQGFSLLSWLVLAIFFALDLRYRLPVAGAFLLPMALAVLVPGLLLDTPARRFPRELSEPLLPLHVSIALFGVAAFGVAFGIALMYLVLERQMKRKKFGVFFERLPPLQFLDQLNRWLLVCGFLALSVTLVTGALFASDALGVFWRWEAKEVATLVAWAMAGLVLGARFFAGWQGRRVAVLTMAGFVLLLVSFLGSYEPALTGVH